MKKVYVIVCCFMLMLFSAGAFAQDGTPTGPECDPDVGCPGPGGPGTDYNAPINQYTWMLALAGIAYGAKLINDRKKMSASQADQN
jgi:hypothetical protein